MLKSRFGFLNWWPADTEDEMLIGAILTQNTSWKNVEKAIASLKESGMLSLDALSDASTSDIAARIRSSGFYRQKAERLKLFSSRITSYGGARSFFKKSKDPRRELLEISGIGNETADSMLLYAGNVPVFVIDAYTRRVLGRVFSVDSESMSYEQVQTMLQALLPKKILLYKDFHAQFVELAKNYCRKRPLCDECPVKRVCNYARRKAQHA
ncbi:MAG: endonuclease III domain-containing protein [Candidatus Micrarchaeia archaeon]